MGELNDYVETTGAVITRVQADKKWYRVYNGTGAAVVNGAVYQISFFDDTDGVYPKLLAPATDAVAHCIIGVVENSQGDYPAGIASDDWGWVQVKGYCAKVLNAGGITDEHSVEAIDGTVVATDDGATVSAGSFAIAKEAADTATLSGMYLLGRDDIVIAGS